MSELHFYSNKSKAQRAVSSQLGKDAVEGKDFHFVVNDERKVAYERLKAPKQPATKVADPFAAVIANAVHATAGEVAAKIKAPEYTGSATKVVDGKKVAVDVSNVVNKES